MQQPRHWLPVRLRLVSLHAEVLCDWRRLEVAVAVRGVAMLPLGKGGGWFVGALDKGLTARGRSATYSFVEASASQSVGRLPYLAAADVASNHPSSLKLTVAPWYSVLISC